MASEHGLRAELEEVTSSGELVMVGVRTPGVDVHHGWRGDDRAYSVFTVRGGRIVALRDCYLDIDQGCSRAERSGSHHRALILV